MLSQSVYADNSSLSVLPAIASKTVGATFNVSVSVNPQGNQVCVVKGTLNFNNLTCKGITVASGLMPQTTPTCLNPNFTLGIPRCTTAIENILTVSVKGGSVGQATASLSNAKVIGVGVLIPSSLNGGTYNIIESAVQATPLPTVESNQALEAATSTPTPSVSPEVTPVNSVPANVGTAGLLSVAEPYFWPLLIIFIIIVIGYIIYWFVSKKRKK